MDQPRLGRVVVHVRDRRGGRAEGDPERDDRARGVLAALGAVRWRRQTSDARRRLLGAEDVDCVAGAGWGGAKSVDRLGALEHVNRDIPAAMPAGLRI